MGRGRWNTRYGMATCSVHFNNCCIWKDNHIAVIYPSLVGDWAVTGQPPRSFFQVQRTPPSHEQTRDFCILGGQMERLFKYEAWITSRSFRIGRTQLVIHRRAWWSKGFTLNCDGVFAISTPWFILYPW